MADTTLVRHRDAMPRRPLERCHDGQGSVDWTEVLGGAELKGRRVLFIHDDVLPPGVSIGVHTHDRGEEYYYILGGEGTMTLDGRRVAVAAGSVTAVFAGGSHGLENTGVRDLRVIVVGVG